ncbi:MAG: hypothetical protein JNM07_13760 [Phycisphaerae bacterium]|nr:hypothetical protein [Phycisphaerae bacterium]
MERNKVVSCAIGALVVLAGGSLAAHGQVFYSQDFETTAPRPEWSTWQRDEGSAFSWFLGRFSASQSATLTLTAPSGGGGGGGGGGNGDSDRQTRNYLVQFHFYCLDSWDGSSTASGYGPDYFQVIANGQTVFNETFANQHINQSYPFAPEKGRAELGFDPRYFDSVYTLKAAFASDAQMLTITWRGLNLQGLGDESWGIDDVKVSVTAVPTPGAGVLGAVGLGAVSCRRRRR